MTAEPAELGRRIRALREEKGLTLTELAERANVTKGYISQIESGTIKKVAANHLFDIAQLLGTEVGYLLGKKVVYSQNRTDAMPGELRELQEKYDVPPEDIRMLADIQFRGERPKTLEGWHFIYQAIKHGQKM